MSKIIITGGAGFIGSHLAKSLAEANEVLVLDNLGKYYDFALKEQRVNELKNAGVSVMLADITLEKMVSTIFNEFQPDIVYHLAAQPGVKYSIDFPQQVIATNIAGTSAVLQACREVKPKRVYYASSSSVYGNVSIPWVEDEPLGAPLSLYAVSKLTSEQLAELFYRQTLIPTIGLRFFTVYGPSGRPDMAYWKFTEQILRGETISLYGRDSVRDFTFINDVIKSIHLLDQCDIDRHSIFNIGGGKPETVLDMILALQDIIGKEAIVEIAYNRPFDPVETCSHTTKLYDAIAYVPDTPLGEGLEKFYQWYQNSL